MIKDLKALNLSGETLFNQPLSKYSTFGVGGRAAVVIFPEDIRDLKKIMDYSIRNKIKSVVLGAGSNVLFRDSGFDGIIIKLSADAFTGIKKTGSFMTVGAGLYLTKLIDFSCMAGFKDLLGLIGIPGTVGGAIIMNASYKTSMSDIIKSVKVMNKDGEVLVIKKEDLELNYRTSNLKDKVVLGCVMELSKKAAPEDIKKEKEELMEHKRKTQPIMLKTAGCVFKNPSNGMSTASQLIDNCGLKGESIGGARISDIHANFIVNSGDATAKDIFDLITCVRKTVEKEANISLETEIVII